jgi:hypothetical protein
MVGKRLLKESDFNQGTIVASFTQAPPGINLTGAYPVPHNTPSFVKLTADKISPGPKTTSRIEPAYDIQITDYNTFSNPLLFSNTLTPVGNESVFLPKFEFIPSTPVRRQEGALYLLEFNNLRISEKTSIYANYTSSNSAEVRIGSTFLGYNQWKQHYDTWISNEYGDYFQWSHTGESRGWQTVYGSLYEAGGQGIYPNLTHPEWQRMIQNSQQ